MPSTARGRLTNTSVRPPQDSPALPKYEAPSHPLNERAQNALQDLPRNHKLDVLKNRLQAANAHLTEAAADINERLYAKNLSHEKAKKRQEAMSSQASGNIDEDAVDIMRNETESMTGKLDQKMREMIDMRAEVANTESALRELDANAVGNRRGPAQTQSTVEVTQMRTQNRSSTSDEDEDEEADGTSSQPGTLVDDLKRKQAHNKKKYEGSSLSERYAGHNDYVGFRKIVHDARHPGEDAPPLPHASTWFPANANGSLDTSFTGAIVSGHDEDEDFQIAGEKISIKCPITYLPMVEPVQSKQCSHNYEKKAILNMISKSEDRGAVEGRRGTTQKRIQCPECDKYLTKDDLQPNLVLLRKIKRLQAAERAENEESDEDEHVQESNRTNPNEISSSPPPTARSLKHEKNSQAPTSGNRNGPSMDEVIPGTQVDRSEVLEISENSD